MNRESLAALALERGWRRDSHLHGAEHWQAVAVTAVELAGATPAADEDVAFAFGWLHDTRRESEGRDPDHGARAEMLARELIAAGLLGLVDERLETLGEALRLHDRGHVSADPTIGVCWDADRLHLPRCGIR